MSGGCVEWVMVLSLGCHSRLHLRPISLGGGGRSRASLSEGLMGDWWIIGDNAGLGCPSRDEFLAVWDNGDWYASDVERLRLTAGFCSSREARSAACSTAARRCIKNLLLLSFPVIRLSIRFGVAASGGVVCGWYQLHSSSRVAHASPLAGTFSPRSK